MLGPDALREQLRLLGLLALSLGVFISAPGCQQPTELSFSVNAPSLPLLDPFSLSVSDYVLKTDEGDIVAAVSAGASRDGSGRLALGALDPKLEGDLRLDVLAGPQLVGLARVRGVAIEGGKSLRLSADVRKPLVVVGAADAPERPFAHAAPQLLDPTTSTDLAQQGIMVPEGAAAGFTADGKMLLLASSTGLRLFDTGSGSSTGATALPFAPSLLSMAPGDRAMALVERGTTDSRVLLYPDVQALLAAPASAQPISTRLNQGLPRAAHFSPSGDILFVLVEAAGSEPCTDAVPAANQIVPITREGVVGAPIALPSYVADFAIDRQGRLVLAEVGAAQVSIMTLATPDGAGGVSAPVRVYAANCPTALRVLDDRVFVVTNDVVDGEKSFTLLRGRLDGSMPARIPIARPHYQTRLNDSSTRDDLTSLNLEFISQGIAASDIVVSPDGNRAVIATRGRYREDGAQPFDFVGLTCTAKVDIVEYGLYSIDLVAGTASYQSRSQNVIVPGPLTVQPCVSCQATLAGFPPVTLVLDLDCPEQKGDRAAGLAAAFAGQP